METSIYNHNMNGEYFKTCYLVRRMERVKIAEFISLQKHNKGCYYYPEIINIKALFLN